MLQENKKNSNPKISSRTSLFWTLPEQLSKLHRAFLQICPKPLLQEKTKPQTPRFLLAHPCFELCQNSSPSYTAHFPKSVQNHCCKKKQQNLKPQDFFSHIPILNSARTALQVTPRISANLSWANVPKKPTKPQTPRFHLTHPCLQLCRSSSPSYSAHFPKPVLSQCPQKNTKPQTPRFHLTHPCFQLCQNSSPSYTAHFRKSVLNHCCKKKQNLKPQDFISHIPVLNSTGTAPYTTTHFCKAIRYGTKKPRARIRCCSSVLSTTSTTCEWKPLLGSGV